MTKSRLYFIFKYDKLLFCSTIMGVWHRLSVIKKSTVWRQSPCGGKLYTTFAVGLQI